MPIDYAPASMRCTVPVPIPNSRAIRSIPKPFPAARAPRAPFASNRWATDGLARLGSVMPRALKPGLHAVNDHRSLEFGENTEHLEHRPTRRRSGIEGPPMMIQVTADTMQLLERVEKVLEAAGRGRSTDQAASTS